MSNEQMLLEYMKHMLLELENLAKQNGYDEISSLIGLAQYSAEEALVEAKR